MLLSKNAISHTFSILAIIALFNFAKLMVGNDILFCLICISPIAIEIEGLLILLPVTCVFSSCLLTFFALGPLLFNTSSY